MTKPVMAILALPIFLAGSAWAQPPQLTPASTVVSPGQAVSAVVSGQPGHFFAVIGSSMNSGFAYGGVNLGVGADVAILVTGSLDAAGQASVVLRPPFQGTVIDRYYVQAVTSTSPGYVPLSASTSLVIRNADVVLGQAQRMLGGIVNPNGSTQFVSTGVTVARTGFGRYRLTIPAEVVSWPFGISYGPLGGRVLGASSDGQGHHDVVLDADGYFIFTVLEWRP